LRKLIAAVLSTVFTHAMSAQPSDLQKTRDEAVTGHSHQIVVTARNERTTCLHSAELFVPGAG
jgi:hypothetical protein